MPFALSLPEEITFAPNPKPDDLLDTTTVAELIELLKQLPKDLPVVGTNAPEYNAPLRSLSIGTETLHEPDYGVPSRKVLHIGF